MPIEFRCPSCSKLLRTPDESAGKKAKCPQCGGIADVPLASSMAGSGSAPVPVPGPPLGIPSASPPQSPFGAAGPTNPYASPAPDLSSPIAQFARGNLVPTRISFDKVFESVWQVFRPQLGLMALSGLIFLGVMIVLQIIGQGGGLAAQQTREPAIIVIFTALNTIFGMVVQLWITIGFAIFMLKAARNEQPSLNDFGAAGPYFLRGILMQIIFVLVSASVLAVCLAPAGVLYLVTGEQNVGVIAAIIGALVAAPLLIYFMYRWFLALFFIVDCNLSPTESLAQSAKFMVGNKLVTFLILLVVSIAGGLFSLVTCCFGYLLFIPYMHLTMAAVYLSATGQPWGQTLGIQKPVPMQ